MLKFPFYGNKTVRKSHGKAKIHTAVDTVVWTYRYIAAGGGGIGAQEACVSLSRALTALFINIAALMSGTPATMLVQRSKGMSIRAAGL